jgi:hypothetical protein
MGHGHRRNLTNRRSELESEDSWAFAFASIIRKLRADGFISRRNLVDELNRRGIPSARGGKWYYTTVVRMLTRLDLVTPVKGRANIALAHQQAADARARPFASTIRELQRAGFVTTGSIAHELNKRKIPSPGGGRWRSDIVIRLLKRLETLRLLSGRSTTSVARSKLARYPERRATRSLD